MASAMNISQRFDYLIIRAGRLQAGV